MPHADPLDPRPVVLVVDDDAAIARLFELTLGRLHIRVVVATRPFGVLNLIAEHRPRLVLLDMMMPGLDGAAITSLIRQDPEIARTVVLLYSAMDEGTLARRATECGADGYVLKSRSPLEVSREVARRLGL